MHRTKRLQLRTAIALLAALGLTRCGDGGPQGLVAVPNHIDFGRVLRGAVVRRTLTLRNDGLETVFVSSVKGNCACFVIAPFVRTLQPGDEQPIRIEFASGAVPPEKLSGKELTILSNDRIAPLIRVPLTGDVILSRTVEPQEIDLGDLSLPAARTPRSIRVRAGPDLAVELIGWRLSPAKALDVRTEVVEGGVDLFVGLPAGAEGTGRLEAILAISLEVSGRELGSVNVNDRIRIRGEWPP